MRSFLLLPVLLSFSAPVWAQPAIVEAAGTERSAVSMPMLEPLTPLAVAPQPAARTSILVQDGEVKAAANVKAPGTLPTRAAYEAQAKVIAEEQCGRLVGAVPGAPDMRIALGEGQMLAAAQQQRFDTLFAQNLAKRYDLLVPATKPCATEQVQSKHIQRIRTPRVMTGNALLDTHQSFDRTMVITNAATRDGSWIPIVYTLEQRGTGYWRIVGLSMAGQPVAELYRTHYNNVLRQKGPDALFDALAKMQ